MAYFAVGEQARRAVYPSMRHQYVVEYERATQAGSVSAFRERLAACFAASLTECLDTDLKPPTEAQVRYVMNIARDLGVVLPSEALRFRGAMTEFIKRFADTFKQKRLDYLKAE